MSTSLAPGRRSWPGGRGRMNNIWMTQMHHSGQLSARKVGTGVRKHVLFWRVLWRAGACSPGSVKHPLWALLEGGEKQAGRQAVTRGAHNTLVLNSSFRLCACAGPGQTWAQALSCHSGARRWPAHVWRVRLSCIFSATCRQYAESEESDHKGGGRGAPETPGRC